MNRKVFIYGITAFLIIVSISLASIDPKFVERFGTTERSINHPADIVQLIVQAWTTQTNDLQQWQYNGSDPALRITPQGSVVIPSTTTTTNEPQMHITNITTPGGADNLRGIKVDYTGITLTNNPDLTGIISQLPASYGSGTEKAGDFSGDGKSAILCSDWEAGYFSDGTRNTWICDGSVGVNTNSNMKQGINTNDVSNPPTDAELDSIFGTPGTVGAGFNAYIDDDGAGTAFYQVVSDGANWLIFTGTVAS